MSNWRVIAFLLLFITQLAAAQSPEYFTLYSSDSLWKLKRKVDFASHTSLPKAYHGLTAIKLVDTSAGLTWNKFGFLNAQGTLGIPVCYDTLVTDFTHGYAIVGRYETYNRTGIRRRRLRTRMVYGVILPGHKIAVPVKYTSVSPLPERLFLVENLKKRVGVHNFSKEIVACRYDFIDMPDSNYIFADLNGEYSVFNMKGDLLFEGLKEVERIDHDSLMLTFFHQYEIKDQRGKTISSFCCDSITSCKPFSLLAFRNGIAYSIDSSAQVKNSYSTGTPCPAFRYKITREKSDFDSLRLMTSSDTTRFPFIKKYIRAWEYRENYAKVEDQGRFGFIDTMGNVKISIQYPQATYYQEGYAHIILKGKWAVIDGEENIIVQPYYQYISPYRHGCAIGRTGKKYYLLNRAGKEINKTPYDSIFASPYKEWEVWLNGVYGLADSTGHEILAPRYSDIISTDINRYIARKDGKYGVVDNQENVIIPFMYDGIEYDPYNHLFLVHIQPEYTRHSSHAGAQHPNTRP